MALVNPPVPQAAGLGPVAPVKKVFFTVFWAVSVFLFFFKKRASLKPFHHQTQGAANGAAPDNTSETFLITESVRNEGDSPHPLFEHVLNMFFCGQKEKGPSCK